MSRAFAFALTAALTLSLATAVQASAQAAAPKPAPEPAPIAVPMPDLSTQGDSAFVTKAAEAGAREVDAVKLGAAKATNPAVKAYAQRLMQDHTTVNSGLTALAKTKRIALPSAAKPWSSTADLAKLSGAAFDRAFVALMVKEHEAAVALFEGESRDGRDADVKEWAAKQLPALREHLAKATSLKIKES